MNSINTFLLTFITKNDRYGQDISSLHRRYQNLSIIYANLGLSILVIIFNGVSILSSKNLSHLLMLAISLPLSFLSLLFIRKKHITASIIAHMLQMHVGNLFASNFMNTPLGCTLGGVMHIFFIFTLTSSVRIHILNIAFCSVEYYCNITLLSEIYNVTLTREQKIQLDVFIPTAVSCSITALLILSFQKWVEEDAWKIAKENFTKSENLTKEVVEAMEAKDNFVSMLSHEIRNPLNALKGSIEYFSQVVKNPQYMQVLKSAKMSGDILLNLVNNILDAAKFKSDKMEIVYSDTDVPETIKKVFTINSENFREKEISATALLDNSVPTLLWTDQSRLLQILMNLISNAVKFTTKGGKINICLAWCTSNTNREELLAPFRDVRSSDPTEYQELNSEGLGPSLQNYFNSTLDEFSFEEEVHHRQNLQSLIRCFPQSQNDLSSISGSPRESTREFWSMVRTSVLGQQGDNSNFLLSPNLNSPSKKKGFLKIQITDTGCGIEEKDLTKLFGMFQQTASGIRSCSGGTGLGLWICKQLCQKMNGDIAAYSKVGQGSSFVLYIPIDNNCMNKLGLQRQVSIKKVVSALVVDDYSINRSVHKLLLEQEGVSVVLANDGKEALEIYKAHHSDPFDFILMDVQMPIMDGFTSAGLIRKWERENNSKKKTDIYFVTGEYFNKQEVFHEFKLQGGLGDCINYLKKPLDTESLKKIVSQYRTQRIRSI